MFYMSICSYAAPVAGLEESCYYTLAWRTPQSAVSSHLPPSSVLLYSVVPEIDSGLFPFILAMLVVLIDDKPVTLLHLLPETEHIAQLNLPFRQTVIPIFSLNFCLLREFGGRFRKTYE